MRIASLSDYLLQQVDKPADGKSGGRLPLNRQIYQLIREAILDQTLPVGLQLPSTRDLAAELGMSRNTIIYAYDQLLAEGYLDSRTGAGTFVADTAPDQLPPPSWRQAAPRAPSGRAELSARGALLTAKAGVNDKQWGAFMPGIPDVTEFPHKVWSRLQNKHWRHAQPEMLTYGGGAGYGPLREEIAEYLRLSRSVKCDASQVMITTGIHQSLDTVIKLLGDHGDTAWVEDPCYWGTRSVLNSLGIDTVPVPVDEEGMQLRPDDLQRPPRFICTTPSHQYPLGAVMSLSRRRTLLEYAEREKTWVIEDDYDSEFRYGGRPLASLQGMDTNDRVLYMGTFSKIMFPGLRIGFLVVPPSLSSAFEVGLAELHRSGQVFLQATLADFMREGHFSSHIRKMRLIYAERLQLLLQAIHHHFGDQLPVMGGDAGLHLTLILPPSCDDHLICEAAKKQGVIVRPLSAYYLHRKNQARGLLLGYASVPHDEIGVAFGKLAGVIRQFIPTLT